MTQIRNDFEKARIIAFTLENVLKTEPEYSYSKFKRGSEVSFVADFLEYNQHEESPTIYFEWCAYTGIAAVLRDNCWIQAGNIRIYPNMYTVIVSGKSSITRKSIPMNRILELIQHVDNTKIIQGFASTSGIFEILQQQVTGANRGNAIRGGSALLFSEELSSFLHMDTNTIETLTAWYDGADRTDSALKGSGHTIVEHLCITLLGTTNDSLIQKIYGETKAQTGGLLARTVLIHADNRRFIKAMYRKQKKKGNMENLKKKLLKISKMRGEFLFTDEARNEIVEYTEAITDEMVGPSGIEGRLPAHVGKLSMILCADDCGPLLIKVQHVKAAIEKFNAILRNYRIMLMGAGQSILASSGSFIITALWRNEKHELSRVKLFQQMVGDVDLETFGKALETYSASEHIIVEREGDSEVTIRLHPRIIKKLEEGLKTTAP